MNAFSACLAVFIRDIRTGLRRPGDLLNPLLFFFMVITLFPLALGPEKPVLQQHAASIVWVAAILSASISLDSMFRSDMEDGSLEQILLSPYPDIILVLAKISAHWLLTGAPLVILALALGGFLYLPAQGYLPLLLSLLLGTPVLSLVGSVAAALTVGLRSGAMLLILVILPLYMPVLIFAVSAVNNALRGLSIAGELYFLGGLLVLAVSLAPLATAAVLRIRMG